LQSKYNTQIQLSADEILAISQTITQAYMPSSAATEPELVILPVDPYHLYAYWHLEETGAITKAKAEECGTLALRIYWHPEPVQKSSVSKLWFDVTVKKPQDQQKVQLPIDATEYSAVIGRRYADHSFAALAISNSIHVPRGRMALEQKPNGLLAKDSLLSEHSDVNAVQAKASGAEKQGATSFYDEVLIDAEIRAVLSAKGFDALAIENPEKAEHGAIKTFIATRADEAKRDYQSKESVFKKTITDEQDGASVHTGHSGKTASGQGKN